MINRRVKDLPVGPFKIGVFRSENDTRKLENGKIEITKGRKQVLDSENNVVFKENVEVPFFQKIQNKRM